MLTLIHGNDTAASRKYFLDEKQQYEDALILDADKVNLTDLAQIFEGGGLFGETKYVFIEHFLTKRKKSADFKEIIAYLEKSASENNIVLWENKELEISSLKTFKQPIIKAFKLPQTLFQLLDELRPGNGKQLVSLFHQTIENAEKEMVFFMIVRQMRLLLALSDSGNAESEIDEIKRMAPWQRGKLQKQASLFKEEELLALYDRLFAMEAGLKTGNLNTSLVSAIDIFLLAV